MYHFFVDESQINGKQIVIYGDDAHHIKDVIRLKAGEEISISNRFDGRDYRCEIDSYGEDCVNCKVCYISEVSNELSGQVTLFQGLPKGDKMELIIQKMVELGVHRIVPVSMKRCVVKLDDKKAKSKVARWQAISEAAAKQSKRAIVPEVSMPVSYKEAIKLACNMDVSMVPYEMADSLEGSSGMEGTKKIIEAIKPNDSIAIFIGPEGGFEESEIQEAIGAGIRPVTLGKRILRTETAGFTMMAWLMYHFEN